MLQEIAKENPDTENIFEDNLIDTYYPQRPINLEALCLYDFVANYDWYGKDDSGNRKYKKLTKSRLPNNKLFDPEKEYEREDYYYSLILLFVPFRDESNLLLQDESTEEAFHRLLPANAHCSAYHDKLGLYGSGYFNFAAKVPSQSCSCAFSVLISLHFLSFF